MALAALSGDEQYIIFVQLCDVLGQLRVPLDPSQVAHAVYCGSRMYDLATECAARPLSSLRPCVRSPPRVLCPS